jgi:hypothetical protein
MNPGDSAVPSGEDESGPVAAPVRPGDDGNADVARIAAAFDAFWRTTAAQEVVDLQDVLSGGIDAFRDAFAENGSEAAQRWIEYLEAWRARILGSLEEASPDRSP